MSPIVWIATGLIVTYILVLGIAAFISLRPFRIPAYISPGMLGLPQEDVEFAGPAGKLFGWWSQLENSNRVLIAAHGYMMNRSELAPYASKFRELGFSTLFLDLRAHGRSDGKMSSFGLGEAEDVSAAIEWVTQRLPDAEIVLMGSSMGAAASALAASKHPARVRAQILDSVYNDLDDAMRGWWRFIAGPWLGVVMTPLHWLAPLFLPRHPKRVRISDEISQIPTLLLHGEKDVIVPVFQVTQIEAVLGEKCTLVVFLKTNHSAHRWVYPDETLRMIEQFLKTQFPRV